MVLAERTKKLNHVTAIMSLCARYILRASFAGPRAARCVSGSAAARAGDGGPPAASDADSVLLRVDARGFATMTLNRPKLFNAFSDGVINRLVSLCADLRATRGTYVCVGGGRRGCPTRRVRARGVGVRGLFLRAEGKAFCAGADLGWMKRTTGYPRERNLADAVVLSEMLASFNTLPFPTVALVQGAAMGGGVGMVSVCDIAVGVASCSFTLSEVKLGLIPATISPYVVARMGAANARRYFLTAERLDAATAARVGLLHEVVPDAAGLDQWEAEFRARITDASPMAVAASKELVFAVAGARVDRAVMADTARRLCDARASPDGAEGLTAFFEKRRPAWNTNPDAPAKAQ